MRLVYVWLTFIIVLFGISITWFAFTPAFYMVRSGLKNATDTMDLPSNVQTQINNTLTMMGYMWFWVAVILVIGLLVWVYVHSQKREWESWSQ